MVQTLKGIKVVDMTLAGAGPTAGRMLAEYGADVILVEPVTGVNSRVWHGLDFYHGNKKSIALNLKDPDGHQALMDLLKDADVFLSSYRLKALDKMGLDWESLHQYNPKLIVANMSGYGDVGPRRDDPGYDVIGFWAMGGILHTIQEKDGDLPVLPGGIGDTSAGRSLALGVINALYHRERTGEAIHVSTSLVAEGIFDNQDAIIESQYGEQYPKTRKAPRHSLLNTYRCKDGWVILITLNFEKDFWNIMRALSREDLVGDPRWTRFTDTDDAGAPAVVEIFDEAFGKLTTQEAAANLAQYGIPCQKVLSVNEVLEDPQVLANNYVFPHTQFDGKKILMPATPLQFGDSEPIENTGAPAIGENSVEILHSLGYSDEKIQDMLARHVTVVLDTVFTAGMSAADLDAMVASSGKETK